MIIVPDKSEDGTAEALRATVTRVCDGDGFKASVWDPDRHLTTHQLPFRFAFIDAPEIDQLAGSESRRFLSALIAGEKLTLALIGKESNGYLPVDPYRRLLCMAFLTKQMGPGPVQYYLNGGTSAGTMRKARAVTRNIELEMVVNGWAWVAEQYAFEREEEYFAAQAEARRCRRGLWAEDNPEAPWIFKRRQRRLKRAQNDTRQARLI